jgi:hypothetical protein
MTTRITHVPEQFAQEFAAQQQITLGQVPAPSITQASTRVCGEVHSITQGDAEVTTRRTGANYAVSFDGTPGGSVMATVQRQGPNQTVELIPGNPSSRTLLAVALREGVIREVTPGRYEDVTGQPTALEAALNGDQQEANMDQQEPKQGEHFNAREESQWQQTIDPLPQHAYDRAVSSVVSATLNGSADLSSTAKALAESSKMDPAQAMQVIQQGVQMYQRVVDRSMQQLGITAEQLPAFYDFARSRPRQLQEAIGRLTMGRDVHGFDVMGVEWMRHSSARRTS